MRRGGFFCKGTYYRGKHYDQQLPRCYRFWGMGHMARWCKKKLLCSKCCGNHDTLVCPAIETSSDSLWGECCICMKSWLNQNPGKRFKADDPQFDHPPQSADCPVKKGLGNG
ncbi:hypothetical protein CROQUDRAFT_681558 [Cronartium quercuum f. sp. fusiforme G11]|uniref:Uncharacterized protein n=1 Tax=Cronartium quercuum f. sp. fusiforme G11 TaxID=708437 RepID=A0A9P6NF14_9BASI|nr:hypothetical protein CROQUDRAFT_681558 [Cronartium quercuum f. sp. fusiforme G11]